MTWFLKQHHCESCDVTWTHEWNCLCDDRCPSCNTSIEYSEIINEYASPMEPFNRAMIDRENAGKFVVIYTHGPDEMAQKHFAGPFQSRSSAFGSFRSAFPPSTSEAVCRDERLAEILGPIDMFDPKNIQPDETKKSLIEHHGFSVVRRQEFPEDFADCAHPSISFVAMTKRIENYYGDWIIWDPNGDDNGYLTVGDDVNALMDIVIDLEVRAAADRATSVKTKSQPAQTTPPEISSRFTSLPNHNPSKLPDDKLYSHLEMEAALCVWEHINETTLEDCKDVDCKWTKLRQDVGSVEMRHASVEIGKWCLQIYDLCVDADRTIFDSMSYDWEVIPLIFSHLQYGGFPTIKPSNFPDVNETALAVIEAARAQKAAPCQ